MKIYLIGMPLSGKTTLGKQLASKLNYKHLDTDQFIEKKYKVKIDQLFNSGQENLFRSLETKALKDCLNNENLVVSTGGGIVERQENIMFMDGIVVFLDISLKTLESRKEQSYSRPSLKSLSVKELYNRRIKHYYSFADIIVSGVEEILLDDLLSKLKEEGYL